MKVEEINVDRRVVDRIRSMGIEELYPPQVEALKNGLLDGESVLLASSTASGKTLLAVLASVKALERGYKTLYLSPLRALTTEKAEYFKKILEPLDVKVAAVSRDYDSPEEWLKKVDIIIATYEKADSLVRHRSSWLKDVGLIVIDEVHLLSDPERGPRLEVAATSLMKLSPEAQRLGLSATVTNYDEISRWLKAKPIATQWRPTPLKEYIYYDGKLYFLNSGKLEYEDVKVSGNPLIGLTLNCILEGGQVMVYAHSRKISESYASKLSERIGALGVLDREGLKKDAEMIRAEGRGLEMAEQLAQYVEKGVAFHHAGLTYQHRRIIEESFLNRRIKVICATPTLAAGVNIPARMVLIPEVKKSVRDLSVMEYKQLAGRAGRPGYDRYGYAVIIASSKRKLTSYSRKYLMGEPEPIKSNLSRKLSWAVLASASSGLVSDEKDLDDFLRSTLLYVQEGYDYKTLEDELEFLRRIGLVKEDSLELTRLGKRVAELCVDPLTAIIAKRTSLQKNLDEDLVLTAIACSPDISPIPYDVPLHLIDPFTESMEKLGWDSRGRDMEIIGKALALKLWVSEVSEETISNVYHIAPGDMLVLKENSEWISSSIAELLIVLGNHRNALAFMEMSERIRHGVKPELLQLCSIEGVGRVRARILYNYGFRTVEDIAKAPVEKLADIPKIGRELALKIKNHAKILVGEV
ncbi:MAG: DEAD/DEAH box helicase [Nitrososphaerota archaeon]